MMCAVCRALASIVLSIALAMVLISGAHAGVPLDGLKIIGSAHVVAIVDGDTVFIDPAINGAQQVRLVGIQAPKLSLGRKNFIAWPLASEAKTALGAMVLNKMVTLYAGGQAMDRHGRLLAHLQTDNGDWVQGRMLGIGMARVYSFSDNRKLVDLMLDNETQARLAGNGIWSHPYYQIRTPLNAADVIGRFEIVQGTVVQARKVKKRLYLNFGDNWRTDFTASLDNKALRLFRKVGLDPLSLEGKTIRVRGWLENWNGPSINLTHPEQIEIVND
jgi:endonuclease YncB( thermonuclease family)